MTCESVRGDWGKPCPDCGQTLPTAKPWGLGRPCSKSALDRGYSWDGRELPVHGDGMIRRWATRDLRRIERTDRMQPAGIRTTDRQSEIRRIVDKHNGNRSAAARELGISRQTLIVSLKRSDRVA